MIFLKKVQYPSLVILYNSFHRGKLRSKLISQLLLIVLLTSACSPAAPAATNVTTANPSTEKPAPKTLTVLAAASLTESFKEMGILFESKNPGITVAFSFGGSQAVAQQLDQGAPADVFASASKKYMDAAVTSKRVTQGDAKTFVKNRLVVIFPKDNPAGLKTLQDLAQPGLKLDLEDKSVPAGQYSLDFLDKAVKDPAFDPKFKENVLKNVVSYETDVKVVLSKVTLGEADAGIVYLTDYNTAPDKLGKLDIPDALNTIANYPIAPIVDSKQAELARAFITLVLSPEGQAVMAKYGFVTVTP